MTNQDDERRDKAMGRWELSQCSGGDYFTQDAEDRRAALEQAVELTQAAFEAHKMAQPVLQTADAFYRWLGDRNSLKPARLVITAGSVTRQPGF